MGLKIKDSYVTVWEVKQNPSGKSYQIRASASKKDKDSGEYVNDWGGFLLFVGKAAQAVAAHPLNPKDRIKIIDGEYTRRYDKEAAKEYNDVKVFEYEPLAAGAPSSAPVRQKTVNEESGGGTDDLPF